MNEMEERTSRTVPVTLLVYCVASLTHFAHNAEFLAEYPNLPVWLSRAHVYLAWCGVSFVGALGYALYRGGFALIGLAVMAVYAGLGFDGLLHYTRAPFAAHTRAMNLTIGFEVLAAGLLCAQIVRQSVARLRTLQ